VITKIAVWAGWGILGILAARTFIYALDQSDANNAAYLRDIVVAEQYAKQMCAELGQGPLWGVWQFEKKWSAECASGWKIREVPFE
jgi:hypothetical protein